ncbi:hypothetical protein [Alicyclobacillus suci]|uniref:hypothetical protein n=1 Tax=Alicyclobacillus suci TaxID=2816080 RepID=UPI001A8FE980|nr:hypothetical protein [Alicyclobacillus suci]
MSNLETLFNLVTDAVEKQQEKDRWLQYASEHFSLCVDEIFRHVRSLLLPLEEKLKAYQLESVKQIWAVEEVNGELQIRFKEKTLTFKPIDAVAKQDSDKYTIQVLQNGNKTIRFELPMIPSAKPSFYVGNQRGIEEVSPEYLSTLIANALSFE